MRRPTIKKVVIWALPILALLGIGLYLLDKNSVIDLPFTQNQEVADKNGVNYGPPTEQEKNEADELKKNLPDETPNETPTPDSAKKPVVVTLISWGQNADSKAVEATGAVNGEISNNGTCTLTMKKGSTIVSNSRASTSNAQGSSCGNIAIAYNLLSAGTWDITMSYSSSTADGASSVATVEVK